MQTFKILLYFSLLRCTAAGAQTPDDLKRAVKGNFDGDGKPEYVWIVKPEFNKDGMGCVGDCTAQLMCSNPHIKTLTLNNSIGGTLTNLGDLTGDGKDEIGLLPDWFTSCWRSYRTYTLKNGEWIYFTEPFIVHCNQWEANIKPLEKIPGKPGYLKENYSAFENNEIVIKSKIIKVK